MSAIEFVVRDYSGSISRGSIAGEGMPSSLVIGSGSDISLNLTRGQIVSYVRNGQALQITLIDGRVITIQDFFTLDGTPEGDLYISSDGYLTEVQLGQGAGPDYFASYIESDGVGKYALNDDLYFMRSSDIMQGGNYGAVDDQVGMLGQVFAAPLLGWGALAAAGAGAAAIIGGGGGSSGPSAPTLSITSGVDSTGHIVNQEDHADGVEIGGTGVPGASIEVTIDGVTETTTVDENGNWEVVFDSGDINTGEYNTPVVVTTTNEGGSTTVTDTLVVDTVIGATINASGGADAVINATEFGSGVQLSGTVTGSSSVTVTIDGVDYPATVNYNSATGQGTWTLDVSTSVLGEGEYTKDITISTSDAAGNTFSTSTTITVDTLIGVSGNSVGGEDGVVNLVEYGSGVVLTGAVSGNDAVSVQIDGVTYPATVTYNEVTNQGTWSLNVPTSVMGNGEYTKSVVVTTTDAAGNSASSTMNVEVDTLVNRLTTDDPVAGDNIVNIAERDAGLTLTGTVEAGSKVTITFAHPSGTIVRNATVDAAGNWSISYAAGDIPDGDYTANISIAAVDAHGNTHSITDSFRVDTVAPEASAIVGGFRSTDGSLHTIAIEPTDSDVEVFQVNAAHQSSLMMTDDNAYQTSTRMEFDFGGALPDGSHLVIKETDTSGNSTATFVVTDEDTTNVVDLGGLDGFEIGVIELGFAENAELTIDLATLQSLSDSDNNLIIHGNSSPIDQDNVTLTGATDTGTTQTIQGKTYDVYTMGEDGMVFVEEGINVTI